MSADTQLKFWHAVLGLAIAAVVIAGYRQYPTVEMVQTIMLGWICWRLRP